MASCDIMWTWIVEKAPGVSSGTTLRTRQRRPESASINKWDGRTDEHERRVRATVRRQRLATAINSKARAQFSSLHALGAARLKMLAKERQHLGP